MNKSTVSEIRERFDNDVDRFSNLETGQSAAVDAPLCLQLVADASAAINPNAQALLDIGCGAGNYTLKLLVRFPGADATLIDLSRPMLDRAQERVSAATAGRVQTMQADIREAELGEACYDVAVAAAVLHHLRSAEQWSAVLAKVYASLRPGGSFWIVDLVTHDDPAVHATMWRRYGDYLVDLRDEAYRDEVLAYIEKEDSPVPLMAIIDHLRNAGFARVQVLHKNICFAALGGVRPLEGDQSRF